MLCHTMFHLASCHSSIHIDYRSDLKHFGYAKRKPIYVQIDKGMMFEKKWIFVSKNISACIMVAKHFHVHILGVVKAITQIA